MHRAANKLEKKNSIQWILESKFHDLMSKDLCRMVYMLANYNNMKNLFVKSGKRGKK